MIWISSIILKTRDALSQEFLGSGHFRFAGKVDTQVGSSRTTRYNTTKNELFFLKFTKNVNNVKLKCLSIPVKLKQREKVFKFANTAKLPLCHHVSGDADFSVFLPSR